MLDFQSLPDSVARRKACRVSCQVGRGRPEFLVCAAEMAPVKTKELGGLRTGQKEDHVERKENLDCYRKKTKMKTKNKKKHTATT